MGESTGSFSSTASLSRVHYDSDSLANPQMSPCKSMCDGGVGLQCDECRMLCDEMMASPSTNTLHAI